MSGAPVASVGSLGPMPELDCRAQQYARALLRDPDFSHLLEEDCAAEERSEVDPGLTREEFLAKYKDLLNPTDE